MYAEASNQPERSVAVLTSPLFTTSANQSLVFYFNIHFVKYTIPSPTLELVVESSVISTLWSHSEKTDENWHEVCVDLPANENMKLHFVSTLGMFGFVDADVAIDDISLKNATCSGKNLQLCLLFVQKFYDIYTGLEDSLKNPVG